MTTTNFVVRLNWTKPENLELKNKNHKKSNEVLRTHRTIDYITVIAKDAKGGCVYVFVWTMKRVRMVVLLSYNDKRDHHPGTHNGKRQTLLLYGSDGLLNEHKS